MIRRQRSRRGRGRPHRRRGADRAKMDWADVWRVQRRLCGRGFHRLRPCSADAVNIVEKCFGAEGKHRSRVRNEVRGSEALRRLVFQGGGGGRGGGADTAEAEAEADATRRGGGARAIVVINAPANASNH